MPAVLLNPSLRRSQATLINLLEVSLYHKVLRRAPRPSALAAARFDFAGRARGCGIRLARLLMPLLSFTAGHRGGGE